MGTRYCMNCGLPVPRRAHICPECGAFLNGSVPHNDPRQFVPPQFSQGQPDQIPPQMEHFMRRVRRRSNAIGLICFSIFIVIFSVAVFIIINVVKEVENARSRHREDMEAARQIISSPVQTVPEISIPDISMPEVTIPEFHMPEPPAADFTFADFRLETDLLGERVLYVDINYKNCSEDQQCFLTNFKISVQQDGKECKMTAGDPMRENHMMEYIQPDEEAVISETFVIEDEKETTIQVRPQFGDTVYLGEIVIPHADNTISHNE